MAKIRSFTSLEQSRKLAEILPLESADMYWWYSGKRYYIEAIDDGDFNEKGDIRAWSLAALLGVLPVIDLYAPSLKMKLTHRYYVEVYLSGQKRYITTDDYESPVDACVAMIERLHELNLL